jgi:hypothetical protein
VFPVVVGTAFKNKGVQPLLDAVVDYLPSPLDAGERDAWARIRIMAKDDHAQADDKEPFAALAFKIMADPFVGQLTFIRVYSGQLKSGESVMNSRTQKHERIGRLLKMHANKREDIRKFWRATSAPWLAEERQHRRHDLRREASDRAGVDHVCGSRDFGCGRTQDQGRPGKDGHGAGRWPRKILPLRFTPIPTADRPSSAAWASCIWKSSSTA